MKKSIIPIVIFAYSRPTHLQRLLACLQENNVPLIYAFADGPKSPALAERVSEVRSILHAINWCEFHLVERVENLGLDTSIMKGVTEIFQKYDTIIVFEDDLVCVPGTYQYMCAALEHYKNDLRVMSITGWTHPRVTPSSVNNLPYFDGRSESLCWGSWARAWEGMEQDSISLLEKCRKMGMDIYKYGADLPVAAHQQVKHWDVRWNYHHILNGGLCLRPPHSMVNHAGFDILGTNATFPTDLALDVLEPCPPIPQAWPEATENLECSALWQKEYGGHPSIFKQFTDLLTAFYSRLLRTRMRNFLLIVVRTLKGLLRKLGVETG